MFDTNTQKCVSFSANPHFCQMGNQQGQTDNKHVPSTTEQQPPSSRPVIRIRRDMCLANLSAEHIVSERITAGMLTVDTLQIGNPKDGYVFVPVQKVKQLLAFLHDCQDRVDRPVVMMGDCVSHGLPVPNEVNLHDTPPPPYEESNV